MQYSLIGIVVKIALHQNNRGAFVAGAGGQVAKRTDQVGKLTGRSAFGCHIANQAAALFHDTVGNGLLQLFTGQVRKIIISQYVLTVQRYNFFLIYANFKAKKSF